MMGQPMLAFGRKWRSFSWEVGLLFILHQQSQAHTARWTGGVCTLRRWLQLFQATLALRVLGTQIRLPLVS